MLCLMRVDPDENVDRWYVVTTQPTLFYQHSVVCGWGRRGTQYARWRIIPAESQLQAEAMVREIVERKLKRGYQFHYSENRAAWLE